MQGCGRGVCNTLSTVLCMFCYPNPGLEIGHFVKELKIKTQAKNVQKSSHDTQIWAI